MPRPVSPLLTAAMKVCRRAVPSHLRARARRWMFEWLDLTWQTRVRLRVGAYHEWVFYNEIFVSGEYDQALALVLDAPRDNGAPLQILDVGANVGFFTLRAVDRLLGRGGRLDSVAITAFEANEAFAREYEARVFVDNGLGSRVRLVPGLVGERSGAAVLYYDSVHRRSNHSGVLVPYVDLSAELARVPRIDLLKCDIEGSEARLIENYPDVFAKTRVAIFELHRDLCDTERCRALLREYGFTHATTMREGEPMSIYMVWR
jgi:FkbM family methyltransferase